MFEEQHLQCKQKPYSPLAPQQSQFPYLPTPALLPSATPARIEEAPRACARSSDILQKSRVLHHRGFRFCLRQTLECWSPDCWELEGGSCKAHHQASILSRESSPLARSSSPPPAKQTRDI